VMRARNFFVPQYCAKLLDAELRGGTNAEE
jgi:hypothetical protein